MMKRILDEIKYDAGFIRDHTLQPRWFKALKAFLVPGFLVGYYFLFGGGRTLVFGATFIGLSLIVHIIYRVKTFKFTRSWLDFKVFEVNGKLAYQRIGFNYYLLITLNLILALLASQLLAA